MIGDGLVELTRPSHRRLLSVLILEAGQRIGTERLIDMFWAGSPPTEAKAALQTHISALRRLLDPDLIKTEGYGYRLALDGCEIDSIEFTEAAHGARRAWTVGDWEEVLEATHTALALWRGSPHLELQDDDFARAEVTRLEETHIALWEMRSEALVKLGRHGEALPELERLVIRHPYRERLWEHLMTARNRLGRHAEALGAFRELTEHLAEIGVEPSPRICRLEEKILLHREELSAPPHNLPVEHTSFIGRESEQGDMAKLLAEHRLVTLTGAGGSGKTRLAVHVAREHLASYPDGCWLVNLADMRDPELIPVEVVRVLGLKPDGEDPLGDLVASIRHDVMLFIIDNCEHLRQGAAEVIQHLMSGGRQVRVLATSREPLHLPGEVVYEVPPLAVPRGDLPAVEISTYDAVRLFTERAALADPHLDPDANSYGVIGSICQRLDGIPLAIELAAAKTRSFSLEAIDRGLLENLRALTDSPVAVDPRHKSLEAAIAWSYELLDEAERDLFNSLSVFRGGFDLDMAKGMTAIPSDAANSSVRAFENLVDKSLVVRERTTPVRYRLLEPVREFAHARLGDSGREVETLARHLAWCVDFASELEIRIHSAGRHELLERLGVEIENLHAGLEWAVEQSSSSAISRIASALAWHWTNIGSHTSCRDALLVALAHVGADALREGELGARVAITYWTLGNSEAMFREAIHAYELVRDLEPSPQKAAVVRWLAQAHSLLVDQDPRKAISLARQAVSIAESCQENVVLVRTQTVLGSALSWAGEVDEGLEVLRQALAEGLLFEDPTTTIGIYNQLFTALHLHPVERRDGPRRLLKDLESRFPVDDWINEIELGWLPYIFLQSGEWGRAEDAIRKFGENRRLEGYDRDTSLMTRGTLCWMRGDLDAAADLMKELEGGGINPRWYHDYYPLTIDIAADRGEIQAVRRYVDAYQAVGVDPSEEANKVGALHPLVRAEVSAALASTGAAATDHMARAEQAVTRMRAILEQFPPPTEGSVAMETHGTHLAFAVAELSRLTGPEPDLWLDAADRADYIYFRIYARFRLAEAVGQAGDTDAASRLLNEVQVEASRVGALGLQHLMEKTVHSLV